MREGRVPLRTVLQNFINHVDSIEARRSDGGEDLYEKEFQELKAITESLKNRPGFECSEGEKEVNRRKNRYKDILPYDYTRVGLNRQDDAEGSDYINANYIRGAGGSRAYIASQGPLPHTLADFWRMVVQCEVQVIVMASNETEGGKHKCECYWVCDSAEDRQFGDVLVSFVKCRQVCPDFLVRTLKITFTNDHGEKESRVVCQFHYSLWPDHGVPGSVRPLLAMVRLVRECQASETLPLLVHCSAGCGRTGTICAIDHVWTLMRTGRLPERVDLLVIVKEMRRQRVAMVQTRDQYILLHRAVRRLFHDRLALIDDHPYANVALDGTPLGCGVGALGGEGGLKSDLVLGNGSLVADGGGDNKGHNNNNNSNFDKLYCDKSNNDSSMDSPSNSLHFLPRPPHNQPHPQPPPHHPHPMLPSPIPVLRPPSPLLSPHSPHGHASLHPNMAALAGGSSAFRAPAPGSGSRSPGSGPLPQFGGSFQNQQSSIRPHSSSNQRISMGSAGATGAHDALPSPSSSNICHGSLGVGSNTTPTSQAGTPNQTCASTGRPIPSNPATPIAPFYTNFSDCTSHSNGSNGGAAENGGGFPSGVEPTITVNGTDRRSGPSQLQQQQYLVAKYSSPNSTPYSTPLGTPGSTPAVTPNTTPNPLQGIGGSLLAPPNPPTPPTRSQTPSPVIALNKNAFDNYTSAQKQRIQQQQHHQQHQMSQLQQQQQTQHQIPHSHHFNHQQQQPRQEQHKYASNSFPCETKVRKGSELTRRPSIQKLREMFETNKTSRGSVEVEDPSSKDSSSTSSSTVKLSRSASSVTLRNSSALSLHSDKDGASRTSRLRRKAGLGSEESLNLLHGANSNVDHRDDNGLHLAICPPPPPLYNHHRRDQNGSGSAVVDRRLLDPSHPGTSVGSRVDVLPNSGADVSSGTEHVSGNIRSACKPPSSPIHTSPNSRRRNHPTLDVHSGANSRMFTADDRPALPIKIKKKSKSFRYAREPPTSATLAGRSPELGRKAGTDSISTYFSLDRAKNEASNGSASGASLSDNMSGSRSISSTSGLNRGDASSGDLNSPRDGFKLSVFQQNILTENGKPRPHANSHSREDVRPEIPPKKYVQDRFRMSQSMSAAEEATRSPTSNSLSMSAEHKFSEAVLGHRHQLVSTYDNSPVNSPVWKSPQSSDSEQSLYDQLPCSHGSSKPHPLSSVMSKSQEVPRCSVANTQQVCDSSRPGKEYVNARLVHSSDPVRGEKRVFVPLPARRTTTDVPGSGGKNNHDYANFSVNDKDQLSLTEDVEHTRVRSEIDSSKLGGVDVVDFDRRKGDGSNVKSSPLYDDVKGPSFTAIDPVSGQAIKPSSSTSFLQSVKELQKLGGNAAKSAPGRAMYEPIDFGENSDDVSEEEVVEVVNREIVGDNYRDETTFSCSKRDSDVVPTEVMLRNSLDPIARQVYQDCEEYLLYGSNKSPVPSLMPKHDSSSLKSTRSSTASRNSELLSSPSLKHRGVGEEHLSSSPHRSSSIDANSNRSDVTGDANGSSHVTAKGSSSEVNDLCLNASMDMTEVKNKVNITPQGLRTRERRNSYRQAVNHVVNNWRADKVNANAHLRNHDSSIGAKLVSKIGPNIQESAEESSSSCSVSSSSGHTPTDGNNKKNVHKYETIWFEKTRETSRSDENLRLTRSVVEDTFLNRRDGGGGGFLGGSSAVRTPTSGSHLAPTKPMGDWEATFEREKKTAGTPEGGQSASVSLDKRDELPGFVNSLERSRLFVKDTSDVGNKSTSSSAGNKTISGSSAGDGSTDGLNSGQQLQNSTVNNCDSSSSSSGDSNNVGNSLGAILSSSSGLSRTDNEPIYVNTTELRAAAAHHQQRQQPQSLPARTYVKTTHGGTTASQHHTGPVTTPLGSSTPKAATTLSNRQGGSDHPTSPQQPSVHSPSKDADSFPLISKPPGPCPTTPSKHPSRTPSGPYMKIPQPKGLGSPPGGGCIGSPDGTRVPFNPSSSGAGSSNSSYQTTTAEGSSYHPLPASSSSNPNADSGNYTIPSDGHHKKMSDYLIKSRSLPPPPPQLSHQKKQQQQSTTNSNTSNSANRKFISHHQQHQQNATSNKFPPNLSDHLEPIYNVPFDQKRATRPSANSSNKYPGSDRSPYHNLSQAGRGQVPPHQREPTTSLSPPQQQSGIVSKGGHVSRALQSMMQQPSRAHIVGDIAIVGDASVKLRRTRHGDTTTTPDTTSRGDFGSTPVAPPRVKRHSSTGGRDSSSEGLPSNRSHGTTGGVMDSRCGTISPPLHRRSTCTADRGDTAGRNSPSPPALPAKTAALHHLLPPPVPPATPPAPPSTYTTNSAASTNSTTTDAASKNFSPIPISHQQNNKYHPSIVDNSDNGNSTYQSLINNNNCKNLIGDELYSLSPTAVNNNINNVNHDLMFKAAAVSRRSAVDDSALVYSFSGSSSAQNNNNSVNVSSKNNSITNAQKRFSYHSSSNNSPSNTIGSVNSSNNINNSGCNIHSPYHHNHGSHHPSQHHHSSSDSSSPHSPSKQPSSSSLSSSKNGGGYAGHDGGYSPISNNHSNHFHHHPHHHLNHKSTSNHRKSGSNINNHSNSGGNSSHHQQHHHSPYHHPPPPKMVPTANTNGALAACSSNLTNHKRASVDFSSYKSYASQLTPSNSNRTENSQHPSSYTALPNADASNSPRGGGGSGGGSSTSSLHPTSSSSNPSSCGRPRNHLLQRSMTSSAILINSNRTTSNSVNSIGGGNGASLENAKTSETSNSNGSDGGGHSNNNSCNNRLMGINSNDVASSSSSGGNSNSVSNGGLPSGKSNNSTTTNPSNGSGSTDDPNVGNQSTPQSGNKFSGLFKKIRSGVTPSRSNTVPSVPPAKQSFVHPDRFGASDGRSLSLQSNKDNGTCGPMRDNKTDHSADNNSRGEGVGFEGHISRSDLEDRGGGSNGRSRVCQERLTPSADGESDRELARDSNNAKQKGSGSKSNSSKKYGFRSKEGSGKGNSHASSGEINNKIPSDKDKTSTNSSNSSSSNISNSKKVNNSNNSSSKVKSSSAHKESSSTKFHNLVSPTSPKPLVRALGKLKFLRGAGGGSNSNGGSSGGGRGGAVDSGDEGGGGRNNHFNPLQKSASVGHNVFTSVVQDCGFPRSPKLRPPSHSPPPARQHYL